MIMMVTLVIVKRGGDRRELTTGNKSLQLISLLRFTPLNLSCNLSLSPSVIAFLLQPNYLSFKTGNTLRCHILHRVYLFFSLLSAVFVLFGKFVSLTLFLWYLSYLFLFNSRGSLCCCGFQLDGCHWSKCFFNRGSFTCHASLHRG